LRDIKIEYSLKIEGIRGYYELLSKKVYRVLKSKITKASFKPGIKY